MKNNRGFTMVELLIVIAILGIVSSVAIVGFGIVNNANVNSVAEEIDGDLSKMRLQNMTKSDKIYLHIRVNNDSYYKTYKDTNIIDSSWDLGDKIGSSSVSIYYVSGSTETLIDTDFTISFSRNGEVEYYTNGGNDSVSIDYLKITNGSRTKKLTITAAGKHFIE